MTRLQGNGSMWCSPKAQISWLVLLSWSVCDWLVCFLLSCLRRPWETWWIFKVSKNTVFAILTAPPLINAPFHFLKGQALPVIKKYEYSTKTWFYKQSNSHPFSPEREFALDCEKESNKHILALCGTILPGLMKNSQKLNSNETSLYCPTGEAFIPGWVDMAWPAGEGESTALKRSVITRGVYLYSKSGTILLY